MIFQIKETWETKLSTYVESLSLGFNIKECYILECWDLFTRLISSKRCICLEVPDNESPNLIKLRWVEIFYVVFIRALSSSADWDESNLRLIFKQYLNNQVPYYLIESDIASAQPDYFTTLNLKLRRSLNL